MAQAQTISLPGGISVVCPDEGALKRPFQVKLESGQEMTCPDARSLVTFLSVSLSGTKRDSETRRKQAEGQRRAWEEAQKHLDAGCKECQTLDQARKHLRHLKEINTAKAVLKVRGHKK